MKRAFTLLELLVVIVIVALVGGLAVSDMSFLSRLENRSPKAVLLAELKNARVESLNRGEELALYFDSKSSDIVLMRREDTLEIRRANIWGAEKRVGEDDFSGAHARKASLEFFPIYPKVTNFASNAALENFPLPSLRFSPDGAMQPAMIVLKINGRTEASFVLDPFSGLPVAKEDA